MNLKNRGLKVLSVIVPKKVRHKIVSLIAPHLYDGYLDWMNFTSVSVVPRPMIVECLLRFKFKKLLGCEVGVQLGVNARSMLRVLNIRKLFLVDVDLTRCGAFDKRIVLVEGLSEKVASKVPNGLDFVYVDGGHDYETVNKDIHAYFGKVRKGGLFGGHDYNVCTGVNQAVNEFTKYFGLELVVKGWDWWVIK